MATVVKRQLRATPHRTAAEVWALITGLITPDKKSPARPELAAVAGTVGQIIASEALKDAPLVVFGNGPRLRITCLYDEDAISGDDANENALSFVPTDGDWKMSVPCLEEDLDWVQAQLARHSSRITARAAGEPIEEEEDDEKTARSGEVAVDTQAFFRS